MPELPEVESLKRSLELYLIDGKILSVEVKLPKLVSGKGTKRQLDKQRVKDFVDKIPGKTIASIHRRAKNLIFKFTGGSLLVAHLKMTGQFAFQPKNSNELVSGGHPIKNSASDLPSKHSYLIFELENGTLYYNDVRQFGYVLYYENEEDLHQDHEFDKLGLEPLGLDFSFKQFAARMKAKKGNLKKLFLDQKVVVGLGNIYCDEVCFLAKIKPTRAVEKLSLQDLERLYFYIKYVLNLAVGEGGSSVANYLLADGSKGNYAKYHFVYNRKNKPCKVCGTTLKSMQLAARTTVFCPHCQPN